MTILMHLIKDGVDNPMLFGVKDEQVVLSNLPTNIKTAKTLQQLLAGVDTSTLITKKYFDDAITKALGGLTFKMDTNGRVVVTKS